jgi:hypothetical protein
MVGVFAAVKAIGGPLQRRTATRVGLRKRQVQCREAREIALTESRKLVARRSFVVTHDGCEQDRLMVVEAT